MSKLPKNNIPKKIILNQNNKNKANQNKKNRPYTFESQEPTVLAWLAGIYQSEATFTSDKRVRSKSKDPNYTPPPPIPIVKLEMVEKDLMNHVGNLVEQNVLLLKRKTDAGNSVYRVTIEAREKTSVFLKAILPYIVGEKTRSKILELLLICDDYKKWLVEGGKSNAAKLAARSKRKNHNPADSN